MIARKKLFKENADPPNTLVTFVDTRLHARFSLPSSRRLGLVINGYDRRAERKKEKQCFVSCPLQLALQLMGKFITLCHKIKFRLYHTLNQGRFLFILFRLVRLSYFYRSQNPQESNELHRAQQMQFSSLYILNNLTSQNSYRSQELIKNLTSSAAASKVFQFGDNKTKELLRSKLNNFHHNYILFCF